MEEENEDLYLDSTIDENTADDYETIRYTYCCSEMCLSRLPLKDIVAACKKFQSLTAVTKQQWILDYLDIHGSVEDNSHVFSFNVGIQRVCQDAWCQVIMLPRSMFYDTR